MPASSSLCNYPQLQEFFYSDSNIVLGYINNDSRSFKAFVANRADFITENTSRQNWKHVGTKENVADYASRGIKAKEFHSEHPWLKGPAFLWEQKEVWNPSSEHSKLETFNLSEDDPDTQKNKSSLSYTAVTLSTNSTSEVDVRTSKHCYMMNPIQGSQNRLPNILGQQEISVGQLQFLYLCPGGQPCLY